MLLIETLRSSYVIVHTTRTFVFSVFGVWKVSSNRDLVAQYFTEGVIPPLPAPVSGWLFVPVVAVGMQPLQVFPQVQE